LRRHRRRIQRSLLVSDSEQGAKAREASECRRLLHQGCFLVPRFVLQEPVFSQTIHATLAAPDSLTARRERVGLASAGIDEIEVGFETGSGVSNLNEHQCWIYDQYGMRV